MIGSRKRRRKRKPSARMYNWTTLFLEDINTGTWLSKLRGVSNETVKYGLSSEGLGPQIDCSGKAQKQLYEYNTSPSSRQRRHPTSGNPQSSDRKQKSGSPTPRQTCRLIVGRNLTSTSVVEARDGKYTLNGQVGMTEKPGPPGWGSVNIEMIKCSHESHWTQIRESVRWRGLSNNWELQTTRNCLKNN
jgi:hypothetical protein